MADTRQGVKRKAPGAKKRDPRKKKVQKGSSVTKPPKLPTQVKKKTDTAAPGKEERKKRPPNFVEEEDIILCKAVVNVSQDAAVGTNQTQDECWQRITAVFNELKGKDTDPEDLPERAPSALKNRFDRHIRPGMNGFNGFYKALKDQNPSGWNEDKFMEESLQNYLQKEGKPFPWSKCCPILWACPKYDPIVCDLVGDPDDDEKKATIRDSGTLSPTSAPPRNYPITINKSTQLQ